MAFSFDSPSFDFPGALVLLAVTIWAWRMAGESRASVRVHPRFAAVLLAALAAALAVPMPGLGFNVMLLTAGVAGAALALAFCFRHGAPPWLSAGALSASFVMGMVASLAAMPSLTLAAIGGAAAAILSACPSRRKGDPRSGFAAIAGAASLLLGGLAMMDGAVAQAALFFASALGLVARVLQKPVAGAEARGELLIGPQSA